MAPVKVKICGITRVADALAAARDGADFLGYNFYPKSPRYVAPENVRSIADAVRSAWPAIGHVGVFVNAGLDELLRVAAAAQLDVLQLHGGETPEYCAQAKAAGFSTCKVFRFGGQAPPPDWTGYATDYFLCDTYDPLAFGGTGHGFDHSEIPEGFPMARTFLAGGLKPGSVAAAVAALQPYGVDVSSGVETAPGIKDCALVAEFIAAAKQPARP